MITGPIVTHCDAFSGYTRYARARTRDGHMGSMCHHPSLISRRIAVSRCEVTGLMQQRLDFGSKRSRTGHAVAANEYDRRNLRLAREVQRDPDSFPHLLGWAAAVMQRLGAKTDKSRETKPDGQGTVER